LSAVDKIITVFPQILTKHINTLCGQNVEMLNVKLVVHIVNTYQLMLYMEIIAVCFQIHRKHTNIQ